MNYAALIQGRKSVRAFREKQVPFQTLEQLKGYYRDGVQRLIPEIGTELYFFGTDARAALEGAAGYSSFLVGAPRYLVLLSGKHPLAYRNAGYMMEDLLLKLTDMDLDSCWVTFTDSEEIKGVLGIDSHLDVAAIAAFGYGKKTVKRIRMNFRSMSDVDLKAKYRYMEPKRSVEDMAFLDTWGNSHGLDATNLLCEVFKAEMPEQKFIVFACHTDETGAIVSEIVTVSEVTPPVEASQNSFEIEIDQITATSAMLFITPTTDDEYVWLEFPEFVYKDMTMEELEAFLSSSLEHRRDGPLF